ncbi:MAG: hypothetical protein FWG15_02890 [Propionibacteriaceae bacterium]|nr:hypothetical protein [Propionibacteriaceae bacterium]
MTSTDLDRIDSWADVLPQSKELAELVCQSDFVPKDMRGNVGKVFAAVMTGRELGMSPMNSLQSFAVINGRASLMAEAMRGLILRDGHQIRVVASGAEKCTIKGRRKEDKDDPDAWQSFTFTLMEAKTAGLTGRDVWQKYPADMLLARATTRMAKAVFSDVIHGLVSTEEAEDMAYTPSYSAMVVQPPKGLETITTVAGEVVEGDGGIIPERAPLDPPKRPKRTPSARSLTSADDLPADLSTAGEPAESMVDSSSADVGEGGSPRATDPPPSPPPQETPPPDDDPVEIIEEVLDAVEMITPKQLQKLHIVLKETGWWNQESREKGLQFYCDVTGRDDITSSKDLTKHEASQVIDLLQQGLEIEDQE